MEQYSLSELCSVIGDAVEAGLPELYWVRAEIASLSVRGHCYMELVEKAENGILAAKVRATCWSSMYHILSAYFEQETGQALHTGMQVLLQVSVEWHAVYGLSLNVQNIDPTYTLGDLAKQRQQTLRRHFVGCQLVAKTNCEIWDYCQVIHSIGVVSDRVFCNIPLQR